MRSVVLVTSLNMAAIAVAAPADGPPETSAHAKELFASALRHFDLTEYPQALAEFTEASRLKDDPALLYDIAQCYRHMNQPEDALRFYRAYLRRLPEARNRAEVETKIAALQEALVTEARSTARVDLKAPAPSRGEPPAPTPGNPLLVPNAPAPKTPLYKKWWLWTAVGGMVVVGVAVGLGVGLSGSGAPAAPE
jgi:tetratricopeptide (TPR) repeat protein